MDASLLPVSLPSKHGFVARTIGTVLPLFLIAGIGGAVFMRSTGAGALSARGFAEAIPLNVASSAAGRITELKVTVGQPVKAGDVIVKLDDRAILLDKQRAEAERGLLQAKLLAEISREDDNLMRAEVWRLRTVAGAQQDQAELGALDKELGRLNGLLGENLVKASDVEPKQRQREALAARVGTFDRAKATGQAGLDEKKSLGSVDHRRATLEIRTAPLREAIRVKQAEIAQIELSLSAMALRSPADGVISVINRRPGEVVAAGEAAVVVVAHRTGVFEIYLPQNQVTVPSVGMVATLSRPGIFTKSGRGRVIEVAPNITEMPARLRMSPQVPVWGRRVLVDGADSDLLRAVPPGDEVRVRF